MEKVVASKSDIIHMKSLPVNNMLQLPLMLYNLDTGNIPLIMNLLNIALSGKFFKLEPWKYNVNYIYNIVIHNSIFYWIILDYNSSYMFWPNCRAIFRLIFEEVECTIDNAFSLRDLVLQELVKIIVVCFIRNLRIKFKCGTLYNKH